MTNLTKLRIHVCPIGYEVDRIVLAAEKLRADRVWIIMEKISSEEKAAKFIKKVKSSLKTQKIEVKEKGVDRDDLFDNLKAIKEIFIEEEGNEIHVNVSAGSKIQAIAGMMACMMFRQYSPIPYYVEPKKYASPSNKPQSSGMNRIIQLPDYTIRIPDDDLITALEIIAENNCKITKKKMTEIMISRGILEPANDERKVDQSAYAKLDHHIIKPLEQWKFIEVHKVGQNHWIKITDAGTDASRFLTKDKASQKK